MVQMRIMDTDAERARAVMELVLQILRDSGEVQVGDLTELSMRGPGARLVVDVSLPAGRPRTIRVQAERTDRKAPRRAIDGSA